MEQKAGQNLLQSTKHTSTTYLYAQQNYYIVSLANQWAIGMPYDFMLATIGGGCPGSGLTQGHVIADFIKTWLPLTGTQIMYTLEYQPIAKNKL